ncbi:MAG: phosphoenolpyruvate hydrolase family protein [Pseudomonadota bacterium]
MRLSDKRRFVVGATAGSGAVAAISAHSGADFLLAINAARLRNMGAPSIACMLPIMDADEAVASYADNELLAQVDIPVLLGMTCWSPDFDPARAAANVKDRGFAGIVNFPPSHFYPDGVQRRLEVAGIGFSAELSMLAEAQKAGCIALAYCRTVSQARQAALAGLDNILLNFGWNQGGRLSPSAQDTIDEAAAISASFARQVRRIRPQACLLLEGGPVETAEDLETVLKHADIDGYIGGSTFERMPVERSISDRIASFKLAKSSRPQASLSDRQLRSFGERAGFVGADKPLFEALGRLRSVREAKVQLTFIHVPIGESLGPPVEAIIGDFPVGGPERGRTSLRIADISVPTQLEPAKAQSTLFGKYGLYNDEQLDVLILRGCEQLAPDIQVRLAADAVARSVEENPVGPRLLLLSHVDPSHDRSGFEASFRHAVAGATISLPPLRQRPSDIETMLQNAMDKHQSKIAPTNGSSGRTGFTFSPAALLRLKSYDWPGNTAELVAVCAALGKSDPRRPIGVDDVETALADQARLADGDLTPRSDRRQAIVDALKRNAFRKGQTAQALGVSRKTLYNWMKQEGLS